jgi:hypothetical protein
MSFYVYRLIDPRDGSAFYVGKGTRNRAWSHEHDAKAGRVGNRPKYNRIMAIVGAGLTVGVEIVAKFQHGRLAYAHEWDLIRNTPDLTNIIGANAEGSEPPPTLGEIKAARIEAKHQQLLKKRESQYAKFVSDLPAHMQQVASEWVSGLKENPQETVLLRTDRLSQRAKPWKEADLEKTRKRRRGCRRKYRPAKPAVQIGGLPPRL